jgi:hypothetical protein
MQEWIEFKKIIINSKNKYNETLNKYITFKKNIYNTKNILEQSILYINNMIDNIPKIEKDELNDLNNDNKLIINKIDNNKNLLRSIIKHHNNIINKNLFNNSYKQCQKSVPNLSKIKNIMLKNISLKDDLDQKINDMKTNYLLLKTLPNNYESYKKYLSQTILEQKNKILEDKMKLIFGDKIDFNKLYNNELKPEIIWNENEIPKLKSEIMILRENKNNLENDLNALNLAFNLALQGNPSLNDSQLVILFRIKEENKLLKKELKKIKEKNSALEDRIKKIMNDNSKYKNNKKELDLYENNFTVNTTENNYINLKGNNYVHTLGDCSLSEIRENNVTNNKSLKPKNILTEYGDNSMLLNDVSNGFTPKKNKRKNLSMEKK